MTFPSDVCMEVSPAYRQIRFLPHYSERTQIFVFEKKDGRFETVGFPLS